MIGEPPTYSNEMATACNEMGTLNRWRTACYKRALVKDFNILKRPGLSTC
jgi:hypothetical protein